MKTLLRVILALVLSVGFFSTSQAEPVSVLKVNSVNIGYWIGPNQLDENVRTMHCDYVPIAETDILGVIQEYELYKELVKDDFIPELTVVYDHYVISFDFTGESMFFEWSKNFSWFNKKYNRWQQQLKELQFYESWGLDKICIRDYEKLRNEAAGFGSVFCFHMNERIDAQVRVFDINSKKLIADYSAAPSTPGIYDGPMVMFFKPVNQKITINLAIRLDQLPDELADFKEELRESR